MLTAWNIFPMCIDLKMAAGRQNWGTSCLYSTCLLVETFGSLSWNALYLYNRVDFHDPAICFMIVPCPLSLFALFRFHFPFQNFPSALPLGFLLSPVWSTWLVVALEFIMWLYIITVTSDSISLCSQWKSLQKPLLFTLLCLWTLRVMNSTLHRHYLCFTQSIIFYGSEKTWKQSVFYLHEHCPSPTFFILLCRSKFSFSVNFLGWYSQLLFAWKRLYLKIFSFYIDTRWAGCSPPALSAFSRCSSVFWLA